MKKFNYQPEDLEADFYGDSKIDVFDDDMLVLEVMKSGNSVWSIITTGSGVSVIEKDQADQLIQFLELQIKNKFNTKPLVILHPNFFKIINKN